MMTFDLNTFLIAVLVGLSSWTLYTLHGLAVRSAAKDEKDRSQDAALAEDRTRIIDVEKGLGVVEKKVAVLESRET